MTNSIKHYGIVDEVGDGCVKVKIIQSSACSSCKIAGHCSVSESKEKIVDVYDDKTDVAPGDKVIVVASQKTGFLAVLLSSVVPLLILVIVLSMMLVLTGNEPLSALSGIISLVPYYCVIYICREKLRARLSFHIETRMAQMSTKD